MVWKHSVKELVEGGRSDGIGGKSSEFGKRSIGLALQGVALRSWG